MPSTRQPSRSSPARRRSSVWTAFAGAGKTTTLAVIREGAEANGYRVEGFAPTSRAAQKLGRSRHRDLNPAASSCQWATGGHWREAAFHLGRKFARVHQADARLPDAPAPERPGALWWAIPGSMRPWRPASRLRSYRMPACARPSWTRSCGSGDAALKQVVEQLAKGQVGEAVQGLERQGRVHEVANQAERIAAIAKEYARQPENTLVVSPDNRSRAEINQAIRTELQGTGVVGREEQPNQRSCAPAGPYRSRSDLGRALPF